MVMHLDTMIVPLVHCLSTTQSLASGHPGNPLSYQLRFPVVVPCSPSGSCAQHCLVRSPHMLRCIRMTPDPHERTAHAGPPLHGS